MMTLSETHTDTAPVNANDLDRFAWRRVWLIGRYMIPTFRKQLIKYPIVITLLTLSGQMFYHNGWMQLTDAGLFSTLCGFMFYFAPVSLARKDNRFIMAQIPARTSEKFVFLLIYYWIVIGLLTIGLNKFITMIWSYYLPEDDLEVEYMLADLTQIMGMRLTYVMIVGSFAGLALQSFALYAVVKAKTNRMITAIAYSLGGYIGMCVLSGIMGGVIAFINIWRMKSAFADAGADQLDAEEVASLLIARILPEIMSVVTLMLSVVAVVLLYKTYKIIRHRGF